jgi:TRAP transporter TAXI family solute receptor
MVQRDEWGYILKIASHTPFHPWAKITSALAQSLDGNREKAGVVSSVGVYTPKFGLGSLENPRMVGRGEVDAGITNPPVTAKLAMEGIGPYRERVGSLRAIARFPEPDYIFWLVDEQLGIASMEDIPRRKPKLTLVSGRRCPTGPDTITWTIEEVMKQYGFAYKDIEAWGGKVLFPGQATIGVPIVKKREANAIFQEGVHHVMWEELVKSYPMNSLGLRTEVVEHMKSKYGFAENTIPKGRLKGIEKDLLTLDYGGWLFFCREDLPDELAYLLAKASMDNRERIAAPYKDQPPHIRSLEVPITGQHLSSKCVIPLHPGAERYYKEIGCL